jgi:chaperonin GroES
LETEEANGTRKIMSKLTKILPAEKVVICKDVPEMTTKSGLYTPSEEKPELGKVYAIGKGKLPISIKVGDIIAYRKYTDNQVTIVGENYNFISFKDVLAVIK